MIIYQNPVCNKIKLIELAVLTKIDDYQYFILTFIIFSFTAGTQLPY